MCLSGWFCAKPSESDVYLEEFSMKSLISVEEKMLPEIFPIGHLEMSIFCLTLPTVFSQCKSVLISFLTHQESREGRTGGGGAGGGGGGAAAVDGTISLAGGKRPSQALILVLLLRLRQTCSHLSLLSVSC